MSDLPNWLQRIDNTICNRDKLVLASANGLVFEDEDREEAFVDELIRRYNAHEDLVEALREIYNDSDDPDVVELAAQKLEKLDLA